MINKCLKNLIVTLYKKNTKIHIKKIHKYAKIINIMTLQGTIDHTLAYKLNYKLLTIIEPFKCDEVKKC
jgi:hypothetical protein